MVNVHHLTDHGGLRVFRALKGPWNHANVAVFHPPKILKKGTINLNQFESHDLAQAKPISKGVKPQGTVQSGLFSRVRAWASE